MIVDQYDLIVIDVNRKEYSWWDIEPEYNYISSYFLDKQNQNFHSIYKSNLPFCPSNFIGIKRRYYEDSSGSDLSSDCDSESNSDICIKLNKKLKIKNKEDLFKLDMIPFPTNIEFTGSSNERMNRRSLLNNEVKCFKCFKCRSSDHPTFNCSIKYCFNCNTKDHKTSKCPNKIRTKICSRCKRKGHTAIECLLYPHPVGNIITSLAYCKFCKSPGHFICPIADVYLIEEPLYSSDQDKDDHSIDSFNEMLITSTRMSSISVRKYCPKCVGNHSVRNCIESLRSELITTEDRRSLYKGSFITYASSKLAMNKNFIDDSFSDD